MTSSTPNSIRVINNFIDNPVLRDLCALYSSWCHGVYPGLLGRDYPSWYQHLCGSRNPDDRAIHDDVLRATPGLASINEIWTRIKEELAPDHGLVRVYANAHPFGGDGAVHHSAKPSDQELVAVVHTSPDWKDRWGGETVFYDSSQECLSIRPRPGRVIVFDGATQRVSRSPLRDCPSLCTTLSFHMRLMRRD